SANRDRATHDAKLNREMRRCKNFEKASAVRPRTRLHAGLTCTDECRMNAKEASPADHRPKKHTGALFFFRCDRKFFVPRENRATLRRNSRARALGWGSGNNATREWRGFAAHARRHALH